jgi:DNA-binding NtrC family response regulator
MEDRLRILLIDDEQIVLKRLLPALEKSGYDVETFDNGTEALERLEAAHFDIVVTDVLMPDVGGIKVLEKVMSASPGTKVIVITGYATIEMAREALAKGAFDFIAKPFKPNDLRSVISRAGEEIQKEKSS